MIRLSHAPQLLRSVETGAFEIDTLVHCQKKPGIPGAAVIENALLKRPVLAPKALKSVVDLLKSKRAPWWGALPLFVLGSAISTTEGTADDAADDDEERTVTDDPDTDKGDGDDAGGADPERARGDKEGTAGDEHDGTGIPE